MEIYNILSDIPRDAQEQVVVIGNFDGLHLGHQELIRVAKEQAEHESKKLVLLTFEPHPRRLFRPDDPPFRITPYHLKTRKLEEFGIDILISLTFDWEFASQSAEDFVEIILKQGLNAAHIFIGQDFCFGQLRKGTPKTIKAAGLNVTTIQPVEREDGKKYSSSTIRQNLRIGELDKANEMLGWNWEIVGTVKKGDQRGRELGYPTANVPLEDTLHPAYGIYACLVQIDGEKEWLPAATNIGIRPMFELEIGQVEAHVLGSFNRDIYDKMLRIKPIERLRGEAKFDSLDALIKQMDKDCGQALEILKKAA